MNTRELLNDLPENIRNRIEKFRHDMKTDHLHRELYICKSSGYIDALYDTGLITDQERKILKVYRTI